MIPRIGKTRFGGFTLVELLVVIGIIGILVGIIVPNFSTARIRSRDAKRFTDINTFSTALNEYFSEYGHYPFTNCSGSNSWTSFDSPAYSPHLVCNTIGGVGQTLSNFMQPYLAQKLADPKSLGGDSGYLYINQGSGPDYCILFWRTPEDMRNFPVSAVPARCGTVTDGKCGSGANSIFMGAGIYSGGC